jgi:hypothetical protein
MITPAGGRPRRSASGRPTPRRATDRGARARRLRLPAELGELRCARATPIVSRTARSCSARIRGSRRRRRAPGKGRLRARARPPGRRRRGAGEIVPGRLQDASPFEPARSPWQPGLALRLGTPGDVLGGGRVPARRPGTLQRRSAAVAKRVALGRAPAPSPADLRPASSVEGVAAHVRRPAVDLGGEDVRSPTCAGRRSAASKRRGESAAVIGGRTRISVRSYDRPQEKFPSRPPLPSSLDRADSSSPLSPPFVILRSAATKDLPYRMGESRSSLRSG